MRRMAVAGIGSRIMRDDGIAVRVVDAVEPALTEQGFVVVSGETDVLYCFDKILPDDFLIVIDAMYGGKSPGSIEILPLCNVLRGRIGQPLQHDFSLLDALALYRPDTQGCLIGIEGEIFEPGFDLSDSLNRRFGQICSHVLREILNKKEEAKHA